MTQFDDAIVLEPLRVVGEPDPNTTGANHPVQYSGPPLRSLSLELTAPSQAGFYEVALLTNDTDDVDPPVLTVTL